MECSSRIYHQNSFGYARRCSCLEAAHLNFGNVALLLTRSQLKEFAEYIADTIFIECSTEHPEDRCIYLPTRDYSLMFNLSFNELKALGEILDQTLLMMQIDDVLDPNE